MLTQKFDHQANNNTLGDKRNLSNTEVFISSVPVGSATAARFPWILTSKNMKYIYLYVKTLLSRKQ